MNNELTTTSILSLFETTKDQRESFVSDVISKINDGFIDPLKIHLQVKCMEDIVKQINADKVYKDAVLTASGAMGQKSFQFHNAKFEIKEVGVKYDFTQCADPVLSRLHQQQAETDNAVKDRETMLKTISQSGMVITDDETGETVTIYPPAKSSTTSVAVTLK